MTNNTSDKVWSGNWRDKVKSRIHAAGCRTLIEFVAKFPAEPYLALAERLGDDIEAFQIEWMHFDEGMRTIGIRSLAIDSLARDLQSHLPGGWRHGAKDDFDTSGAYADWVVRLEQYQPDAKPRAKAVWGALEELCPPVGWIPSGPDDPLIQHAFSREWPET